MIETGQIRRAILVAGENGAPLVEKTIQLLNEGQHDRKSIKPFCQSYHWCRCCVVYGRRDMASTSDRNWFMGI